VTRTLGPVRRHPISALIAGALLMASGCAVDMGVSAQRSEQSPAAGTPDPAFQPSVDTPSTGSTLPSPSTTAPTVPGTTTETPILLGDAIDLAEVADLGDDRPARDDDAFVAAALVDIDGWIAEFFPAVHGREFSPLERGVYPVYTGRTDVPACGGTSTRAEDVSDYGAFYCPIGDFIVYDDDDTGLLGELRAEFGPVALGVVLAHEHAHAVQARTGDLDRGLATIILEQHADCIAGAWAGRAATGGSDLIRLSDADIRGALITMVAVRDPVGIDQFAPGSHGSAFDRVGAFQEGFREGPGRCAELIDEPLPLMPNQFQTLTDRSNDGDLPFGYADGQIVPLVVDALNAYWAFEMRRAATEFAPLRVVPVSDISDPEQLPCAATRIVVVTGLVTCSADGSVFLDDAVARDLYEDPIDGRADFAVAYLLALAWSEEVQSLLGSDLRGVERALANDCLTGAWSRDLDPRRPPRPTETDSRATISPGDLDEAVLAAIEIAGDSPDAGTAFDKVDAFRTGVLGGLAACTDRIDQ
jgi:predicted metalloprotease